MAYLSCILSISKTGNYLLLQYVGSARWNNSNTGREFQRVTGQHMCEKEAVCDFATGTLKFDSELLHVASKKHITLFHEATCYPRHN